jgi:hypothetical protein
MNRLCHVVTAIVVAGGVALPAAACGHNHKGYPVGAITCTGHRQFQCGDLGVWHPVPDAPRCDADPKPQPADDPAKDKDKADKTSR